MGEVIPLGNDYVATCPKCDCQAWYLDVDPQGNNIQDLVGVTCMDCGHSVVFEDAE